MREIIQFLFEVYHIEFDFLCRDLKVADRCNFLLISNSRSIFFAEAELMRVRATSFYIEKEEILVTFISTFFVLAHY